MSGVAGKVQAPQAAGWEEMAELLKGPEGHPPQLSWAPSHSPLVGGGGGSGVWGGEQEGTGRGVTREPRPSIQEGDSSS